MYSSKATHCKYGHPLQPNYDGQGKRCAKCNRKAAREYMRRRRAKV